jgi:hypothetical protein
MLSGTAPALAWIRFAGCHSVEAIAVPPSAYFSRPSTTPLAIGKLHV